MYFNSFENTLSQYNKTFKTKDLEKYLSYFDFEKMLDEEINSDEEFAQSLVFLGAMSGQSVKELKLTYLKNVENSFKDDFLNTVKTPKKSSLKSDIKQHGLGGIRTLDQLIKSQLRYQLRYKPITKY